MRRALQLSLGAGVLHLVLLWCWNPRVQVGPPRRAPGKSERSGRPIVVVLGGDTAPTDAATGHLRRYGYEYPFSATLELTRQSDLTLVNLETAVSHDAAAFPLYKRYVYRTDPEALAALRWAGVDAVTLGNNHIMDHGPSGLVDTLDNLQRVGIVGLGAGRDVQQARRGVVFALRGTRVGLLSYLEDSFMHSLYVRSFAWGPRPGCARLELAQIRADVARMRRHADLVFVSLHWGRSYSGVTLLQRFYARALIDAGADLVYGHHPHVHHPVGMYRGKPIIYSLGNFAFGTRGRAALRYGLIARLRLHNRRIEQVELIPLLVQNRLVQFKPERLVGAEAHQMLATLQRNSREHGASLRVAGDRALLEL